MEEGRPTDEGGVARLPEAAAGPQPRLVTTGAFLAGALLLVGLLLGALHGTPPAWSAGLAAAQLCLVLGIWLAALVALLGTRLATRPPVEPLRLEAWLCRHCVRPFVPGAHVCPRCACPISSLGLGMGEYEQIWARAWGLGRAAWCPRRSIHVGGMSLLVLPWLAAIAVSAPSWGGSLVVMAPGREWWLTLLLLVPGLLFYGLLLALWGLCVRNWLRHRRGDPPALPESAYGAPPWWSGDARWALPAKVDPP